MQTDTDLAALPRGTWLNANDVLRADTEDSIWSREARRLRKLEWLLRSWK